MGNDTTKTCTKCGEEKPLSGFDKSKKGKFGYKSKCKVCQKESKRRYYEENREEIAERKRRYREKNREEIAERKRRYREKNRENELERHRRYREKNREEIAERKRRYYEENRENELERHRRYREENREEIAERKRRYCEKNREEIAERNRRYYEENREEIAERKRRYYEENREEIAKRKRRYCKRNPGKIRAYSLNRRARKRKAKGTHTKQDIRSLYEGQAGKCWYCACDVGDDFHVDHFIPLSKGGSNDVGNLRIACPSCNLSKQASDPHKWSGRLL